MDEELETWRKQMLANIEEVKRVCSEALFDPRDRGVIVIQDEYGNPLSAELSDAVEYGKVLLIRQAGAN